MTETQSEEPPTSAEVGQEAGSPGLDPRLERGFKRAMDLGERAFFILLFAAQVVAMAPVLAVRPWNGLLLVSNGLIVVFIIFRRQALAVSTRPFDWLIAILGSTATMLYRPGGHPIAPPQVVVAVMIIGLLVSIWAKLTLRRSFGLAAANRGLVRAGPYSFVRHPMYTGYILVSLAFILVNPTVWNISLCVADVTLQILRVLAEERILSEDPNYAEFKGRVRYRLAPGLF